MDALALYRLTSVPEPEVRVTAPTPKRAKIVEPTAVVVSYSCFDCHKPVQLTKLDAVQCSICGSRVVRKILSTQVTRTYNAV